VTSLEGRWKLGQQRSVADRLGVLQGLTREGDNPLLVAQLTALEQARQ
jgi:predicted FMN-binding regulatory protein PaiB